MAQESGDPEQIKAALEEAKRAGADEVGPEKPPLESDSTT